MDRPAVASASRVGILAASKEARKPHLYNTATGVCPTGPIAPPVSIPVEEYFTEFSPHPTMLASRVSTQARSPSSLPLHRP